MNIRELDLNLLLIFDAIYRERSISAAGKRLGLSQPAISNALRRLRDYTGDTLFFRNGGQMMPTRVASIMAVPIRHALTTMEEGLSAVRSFDPATSKRTFRIACIDTLRSMLGPTLVNLAERKAPNIVLEFVDPAMTPADIKAALHNGDIDLALLPTRHVDETVGHEHLIEEQLVLVVRHGHPALNGPMTHETLAGLRHVVTSAGAAMRTLVDMAFQKQGVSRKVACIVPGSNEVAGLIETSDLVCVMGRSFALSHMRNHAVTFLNAPVAMPKVEGAIVWSKTSEEDQGLQWMRRILSQVAKTAVTLDT